jgi:glucosylceramidase
VSTTPGRREFLTTSRPDLWPPREEKSADSTLKTDQLSTTLFHKPIQVWVTDAKRRLAPAPDIAWGNSAPGSSAASVVLRPEFKFQQMLGFGAAMTDAACYVFSQLPSASRATLFHTLFSPTELAFNVCRICVGSSDCSTSVFSYDDGDPDPDLRRFSIERDRRYVIPTLREARSFNPDLFLFASPWSPPGWMKSNGSLLGGCMRHTYMASYANYFLEFLRSYESEQVPVQAVTIQNEVDADQDGTMPACTWPQDYEADFLTMHLGPLFQRAGVATKIWIIDHNYNLWGRAIGELETPDVRKYTNAVAWHGYVGRPQWIRRVQNAFPEVEMYWTEGGPDYRSPDYTSEWARWGETFTSIVKNCCRSLTVWTLASDENGRPYVGGSPTGLGGAMLIHSKTHKITYSGMFRALAHFSKFVRRGSKRIDSQGELAGLFHCAFENPDGSLAVVLTNQSAERPCELRLGTKVVRLSLSSDSVTTLLLSNGAQEG